MILSCKEFPKIMKFEILQSNNKKIRENQIIISFAVCKHILKFLKVIQVCYEFSKCKSHSTELYIELVFKISYVYNKINSTCNACKLSFLSCLISVLLLWFLEMFNFIILRYNARQLILLYISILFISMPNPFALKTTFMLSIQ